MEQQLQKIVTESFLSSRDWFQRKWTGDPHVLDLWCVIWKASLRFLSLCDDSQYDISPFRSSQFPSLSGYVGAMKVGLLLYQLMPSKRKKARVCSVCLYCNMLSSHKNGHRQFCLMKDDQIGYSVIPPHGYPNTERVQCNFNFDLSSGQQHVQENLMDIPKGFQRRRIKVCLHLLFRLSPLHACRLGEAKNPGPESISFKIGLINPTAVYNKHDDIQLLQCHTYALSENSATTTVQAETERTFRNAGIKSVWSPPVAPHAACTYDTAKRGQASGVSIHSHYPISPSPMNLEDNLDSTRIVSSIVHIGPWHIQVIVIYGVPSCHPRARDTTDQLLLQAGKQALKVKLPALIMGDFNHPPHTLRAMMGLADKGYQTTQEIYQKMYGDTMPSTCRDTTCNDQMIIHPELIPFVDTIAVDKSKCFSDHDPVLCTFQLPGHLPVTHTIKHPATWTSFDPQKEYISIAFEYHAKTKGLPIMPDDNFATNNLEESLIQWTKAVEQSVDWAIRMQHIENPDKYPAKKLPKNAQGRAKQCKIVKKPLLSCLRPACQGQYTPQTTGFSIQLSQKVRQVRRIQSLYFRWQKLSQLENGYREHHLQLQQEWKSILKAPGYQPNFSHWCAQIPELSWCPLYLPNPEFLHLLLQFVKHDCDQLASKVASNTRKVTKYEQLFDSPQNIYAKTAKKVRRSSPDIIQEIRDQLNIPAQVRETLGGLITLQVESTCLLQPKLPLRYAGFEATIVDITPQTVDICLEDADQQIPLEGNVTQEHFHTDPEVLASKLDEYWGQFWCRDGVSDFTSPNSNPDSWESFQRWLETSPVIPPAIVRLDDHEIWENTLRQMNPKTARGIDSWTVDELRTLPTQAIRSLSQIFHRFQGEPFPDSYQIALTIPLGKEQNASSPSKTRPITVLSLLYRWWSKVVTSQILRHWAKHLPDYIVGFIPGRSPQTEMVKIQHAFEISHIDNEQEANQWQGLTLDLVKCFNLIPREPAKRALQRSGVPEPLIQVWFYSLQKLNRYWKFRDTIVASGQTTTGAPEGDTFSVLCCVALSRLWAHHLHQLSAIPSCYADNWSWRSQHLESNIAALEATKEFTAICRLRIDWGKTWAWITYHENKAAWKIAMKRLLPPEATLQVVTCARELGYTMHYNKVQSRTTQKQRHQAALEQVLKIRRMPVTLQIKAQLLTDACLSKALCHTETYHVGAPWFRELRAAMSRTLVPDRKITNPYLAVMLLSKYIIDPELYYIQQCIRVIRRFLISAPDATRTSFLKLAARHNQRPMQVHGPAGTIATSLMKLGWKLTATGTIHTDTMLDLNLLQSPLSSLMKCSINSWMKNISQFCLIRPEWRNLPIIDRTATLKIFMNFSNSQQLVISRFLTGSYMEPKQIEHIREGPVMCEICTQDEDTMNHRLMKCSGTEYVRQEFPDVIDMLENYDPCHLHMPVVYQDEFYDFNTWFFHQDWQQEVNEQVLNQITHENNQGKNALIFSDGSCRNPTFPSFRRASYALVYHQQQTSKNYADIVTCFQTTQKIPSTFQVFATGPCSDFQSIPRAELLGAMVLMKEPVTATLYTDSQYVIDICTRLGYVMDLAQAQAWANFDILQKIWIHLQTGRITIKKVKAHDITRTDPPNYETFVKIGNHAADTAAKAALTQLDNTTPMHENLDEQTTQLTLVEQQMQFRHSIQVARAKCLQQKDVSSHPQTYSSFHDKQERLILLQYNEGIRYHFDEEDFDKLQNSLWGTTFSHRLLHWLSLLQWPTPTERTSETGITWFELAVNFQTVMQSGLVVNIGTTGNNFVPKQLTMYSHEFAYSKQVAAFERAITTMATLLRKEILPFKRQLSSSLRLFGASHGKQGLATRPQMPLQRETLETVRNYFLQHRGKISEETPQILKCEPHCYFEEHWTDQRDRDDWKKRIQRYNCARKRR